MTTKALREKFKKFLRAGKNPTLVHTEFAPTGRFIAGVIMSNAEVLFRWPKSFRCQDFLKDGIVHHPGYDPGSTGYSKPDSRFPYVV